MVEWSALVNIQYSSLITIPVHSIERRTRLVEGVGTGSPPGEEQAQADGLEHAGHSANGNCIEGTLLGEDLADELLVATNISQCQ